MLDRHATIAPTLCIDLRAGATPSAKTIRSSSRRTTDFFDQISSLSPDRQYSNSIEKLTRLTSQAAQSVS